MDNRTALLDSARSCLEERGYARTSARDVATRAGVSLAAIGYHFRTLDALLVEAIRAGVEDWSSVLDEALDVVAEKAHKTPRDRLSVTWDAIIGTFDGHRGALAASFELMAVARQDPDVTVRLEESLVDARRGLASQLYGIDATVEPDRADQLGAAAYAMVSGLAVQWLVDPQALPSGEALVGAANSLGYFL